MRRAVLLFFLVAIPFLARASDDLAVLNEINLARTRPQEYAGILEARMRALPGSDERCVAEAADFLRRQRPLEPLQSVPALSTSARAHVSDQGITGEIGHRDRDGSTPFARMERVGQWIGRAGEAISYGYSDARTIVVTLIVDQGVMGRGHRRNIFSPDFKVAGAACGPHARYGSMCVIDFADGFVQKGEKVAIAEPAAPWWQSGDW